MELYKSPGGTIDRVSRVDDTANVRQERGYVSNGRVSCVLEDTGNGFIAMFPAPNIADQDYYACLSYSQARDLVLAFSAFKGELGFEEE